LTNVLAREGTSTESNEGERHPGESAYGGFHPDPAQFAIHQKLDAIVTLVNEHKVETRAENALLNEKLGNLESEVTKVKRKFEETGPSQPGTSKCARIPRSLSVSSLYTMDLHVCFHTSHCLHGGGENITREGC